MSVGVSPLSGLRGYLEEVGEHELTGHLDGVDLQGGAGVHRAVLAADGGHTQGDRLGGAQQLVVNLAKTNAPKRTLNASVQQPITLQGLGHVLR